jgi:hypothetical protein
VADGNRVALTEPNGACLVDATDPRMMRVIGDYCADMPGLGSLTSRCATEPSASPRGARDTRRLRPTRSSRWNRRPAMGEWRCAPSRILHGTRCGSPCLRASMRTPGSSCSTCAGGACIRCPRMEDVSRGMVDEQGGSVPAGVYFARVSGLPGVREARIVRLP